MSDSHGEGKVTAAIFVDFFYNHFDYPEAVHDIVWYGPSSEFKNKFMVKFLQSLCQKLVILVELLAKLRL